MNKKDVYTNYGIAYQGGKIASPLGRINPLLVKGNAKLGAAIYHFSTLPGTGEFSAWINGVSYIVRGTCACDCAGCYAKRGNYQYQSSVDALAMRTVIARYHLDYFKRAVIAQVAADNVRFVRVHAAGDFFSEDYINAWREIATACPSVVFWTYTKNPIAEHAFDDIANFNVVSSVIPGKGFNFGHCDYILAVYEALKSAGHDPYICRCGIDKNQHCSNCKGCSVHKYVLFLEHGTGYNAERDPLFPVVKALIDSQDITIATESARV